MMDLDEGGGATSLSPHPPHFAWGAYFFCTFNYLMVLPLPHFVGESVFLDHAVTLPPCAVRNG